MISSLRGTYRIVGQRRTSSGELVSFLTVIGIDFASPLLCEDRSYQKLYLLLVTCEEVCAIHLELTDSLSLLDFMLVFRRFLSRPGLPEIVYSNNAKTFKAASTALQNYFSHFVPHWKFIVPRSPWWEAVGSALSDQ